MSATQVGNIEFGQDIGGSPVSNVPTGVAAGDLLIAYTHGDDPAALGGGWTAWTNQYTTGLSSMAIGSIRRLWWRVAASEPSNYTFNNGSAMYESAILALRGTTYPDGTENFDVSNPAQNPGLLSPELTTIDDTTDLTEPNIIIYTAWYITQTAGGGTFASPSWAHDTVTIEQNHRTNNASYSWGMCMGWVLDTAMDAATATISYTGAGGGGGNIVPASERFIGLLESSNPSGSWAWG